jgi:hypothetical protein
MEEIPTMRAKIIMMAMVAVAGAVLWMGTGCEEADGLKGLAVSPATVTLGGSNAASAVEFTAAVSNNLALPLEWRVSDPSLGDIRSQSGAKAIYTLNPGQKGDNVITVRDQYKNEGSAIVTQQ